MYMGKGVPGAYNMLYPAGVQHACGTAESQQSSPSDGEQQLPLLTGEVADADAVVAGRLPLTPQQEGVLGGLLLARLVRLVLRGGEVSCHATPRREHTLQAQKYWR